jgi:hypothetical protein
MSVATSQGWDFHNLHNFFMVFPIANLGVALTASLATAPTRKTSPTVHRPPLAITHMPIAVETRAFSAILVVELRCSTRRLTDCIIKSAGEVR